MRSLLFATAFTAIWITLGAQPADACSPPLYPHVLAPTDGATDVPLDAAIWTRDDSPAPTLSEADTGVKIALTPSSFSLELTRWQPERLAPHTRYRVEGHDQGLPAVFETGVLTARAPAPVSHLTVDPGGFLPPGCTFDTDTMHGMPEGHAFVIAKAPGGATTMDALPQTAISHVTRQLTSWGFPEDAHIAHVSLTGEVSPTVHDEVARRAGGCAQSEAASLSTLLGLLALLGRARRRRRG